MPFAAKRAECWVEFRTDGGWGITRISGRPEGSRGGRVAPSSALSGRFLRQFGWYHEQPRPMWMRLLLFANRRKRMYQKVSTDMNFAQREEEVIKFWRDEDIFKKTVIWR